MDQIQIGKFIAACRKEKGMTQAQLAEKMSVSDRAVSKWETGKNLPDSSIMLDLCSELGISVNDLLNGRRITMENYKEIAEKTMLEMRKAKEQNDRMMLQLETLLCSISIAFLLGATFIAAYVQMAVWLRVLLIAGAIVQLLPCVFVAFRIEQIAGYYKCNKCGETWIPKYYQVFFAPHLGRSRLMKCPKCQSRCYHKKTLTKDE